MPGSFSVGGPDFSLTLTADFAYKPYGPQNCAEILHMADMPLPAAHDLQIKLHFLYFVRVISPIFLHIYTAQLVPAHFVCRISRHHTHMQKFCAKYMTCASICKTTLIYCPDSIPLINPLLTVIFPVHLIRLNNLYFSAYISSNDSIFRKSFSRMCLTVDVEKSTPSFVIITLLLVLSIL